jgi:hypothetical protein
MAKLQLLQKRGVIWTCVAFFICLIVMNIWLPVDKAITVSSQWLWSSSWILKAIVLWVLFASAWLAIFAAGKPELTGSAIPEKCYACGNRSDADRCQRCNRPIKFDAGEVA